MYFSVQIMYVVYVCNIRCNYDNQSFNKSVVFWVCPSESALYTSFVSCLYECST